MTEIVLEFRDLTAKCNLDPCALKLYIKCGRQDQMLEAAKLESRADLQLRNGIAAINESFRFVIQNQDLQSTKMVVMVMASKAKQVSLLGVLNLDVKQLFRNASSEYIVYPLEKCSDPRGQITVKLIKNDKLASQQTSNTMSISARSSHDTCSFEKAFNSSQTKPTSPAAGGVPLTDRTSTRRTDNRNYDNKAFLKPVEAGQKPLVRIGKRNEAEKAKTRTSKSKESLGNINTRSIGVGSGILSKQDRDRSASGSYRKRFEYSQNIAKPSHTSTTIFTKKPTQKSPAARRVTPQPIKFDSAKPPTIIPKQNSFSIMNKNVASKKPSKPVSRIHTVEDFEASKCESPSEESRNEVESENSLMCSGEKYRGLIDKLQKNIKQIENSQSPSMNYSERQQSNHGQSMALSLHQNNIQSVQPTKFATPSADKNPNSSSPNKLNSRKNPTQSVCTFGDNDSCVKSSTNNIPEFHSSLKLTQQYQRQKARLQSELEEALSRVRSLEEQKVEHETLINKLSMLYEEAHTQSSQEIQRLTNQHQKQVDSLRAQIYRMKEEAAQPKQVMTPTLQPRDREVEIKSLERTINRLSVDLKFKQNELKFAKLNEQNLAAEKKQLQQQITELQNRLKNRNIPAPMTKQESRAKMEYQMLNDYPATLRSENKILRSQIQLLQTHNQQLLATIEQSQKTQLSASSSLTVITKTKDEEIGTLKNLVTVLEDKNKALAERAQSLQEDLFQTKKNFAETMNIALQNGGSQLVELIEAKINFRQKK